MNKDTSFKNAVRDALRKPNNKIPIIEIKRSRRPGFAMYNTNKRLVEYCYKQVTGSFNLEQLKVLMPKEYELASRLHHQRVVYKASIDKKFDESFTTI